MVDSCSSVISKFKVIDLLHNNVRSLCIGASKTRLTSYTTYILKYIQVQNEHLYFQDPEAWVGNKKSEVGRWILKDPESRSVSLRERQKVKLLLSHISKNVE